MKDDAIYLRHILECIRRAEENTAGGSAAFMASHTLQDAVLRNLQTMAESTQRLSDAVKSAYPTVEWRAISGFRNVIVHNYLGIDLAQIGPSSSRTCPRSKPPWNPICAASANQLNAALRTFPAPYPSTTAPAVAPAPNDTSSVGRRGSSAPVRRASSRATGMVAAPVLP